MKTYSSLYGLFICLFFYTNIYSTSFFIHTNPEYHSSFNYKNIIQTDSILNPSKDIAQIFREKNRQIILLSQSQDHKEAIKLADELVNIAIKSNNKQYIMRSYFSKAEALRVLYNWKNDDIIPTFNKAKMIAEELGNLKMVLIIEGIMASYYSISGNYTEAIQYHKKILNELISIQNQEQYKVYNKSNLYISRSYNYIVKAYLQLKEVDSAQYNNDKMKTFLDENKRKEYWEREYFINEGEINFLKEEYTKAEYYIEKAYALESGSSEYEKIVRNFQKRYKLGRIAFMKKEYQKTIDILKLTHELHVENPQRFITYPDYFWYLAKAYKEIGDHENAILNFENYITNSKKIANLKDNFSVNLRKNEIDLFKKEIKELEINKNEQQNIVYYLLGIFVSIIIVLFYVFKRKVVNNKKKFDQIIKDVESKKIIVDTKNQKETAITEKQVDRNINEDLINKIDLGLQKLESKKYFLNTNCSSASIAKKLKTNPRYISYTISTKYHKNFKTYINDLRINYALVRLKNDSKFRRFSMESISKELGYKSTETFNKHFKSRTGLLPSYYIKQLEKSQS